MRRTCTTVKLSSATENPTTKNDNFPINLTIHCLKMKGHPAKNRTKYVWFTLATFLLLLYVFKKDDVRDELKVVREHLRRYRNELREHHRVAQTEHHEEIATLKQQNKVLTEHHLVEQTEHHEDIATLKLQNKVLTEHKPVSKPPDNERNTNSKVLQIKRCGIFFCVPAVAERGILMAIYSVQPSTFEILHSMLIKRAKEHRAFNTSIPIAVATQNITSDIIEQFDYVIQIPQEIIFDGAKERTTEPGYRPQWRTRLLMYGRSPFNNTLAIDSDVKIFKSTDPLFEAFEPYDFAVLNGRRDAIYYFRPHNCVMMFKNNINNLFDAWWQEQLTSSAKLNEDDQGTLFQAMQKVTLKYGLIQSSGALSYIFSTEGLGWVITPIVPANSVPILIHKPSFRIINALTVSIPMAFYKKNGYYPKRIYNEEDCEACYNQPYDHWTFSNPPSNKLIVPWERKYNN